MTEPDSFREIDLQVAGGVATIRFAKPQSLNAASERLLYETLTALYSLERRDDVSAVVVTGTGRSFSSGFDLSEVPLDPVGADGIHAHFRIKALLPRRHPHAGPDRQAHARGRCRARGRRRPGNGAGLRSGRVHRQRHVPARLDVNRHRQRRRDQLLPLPDRRLPPGNGMAADQPHARRRGSARVGRRQPRLPAGGVRRARQGDRGATRGGPHPYPGARQDARPGRLITVARGLHRARDRERAT